MDNPYPICENRIFVDEPLDKDPCQECNRAFLAQRIKPNFVSKRKPQTNADRIRAMDIDHLIEWFCRGRPCGTCQYSGAECGIRDWLSQEAGDDRSV